MLKSLRTTLAIVLLAMALAAPAFPQQSAKPNESPSAMKAPAAVPQRAATLSAQQEAAEKKAEKAAPEQQELAHKVTDAMYMKDFAAMKRLFAPSTLRCIGKNEDFLHDRIEKQFELPISRTYHLTITKLPPDVMNPTQYFTFPMPATHLMGMEFATPDGGTATVNETIGQENGKWYEVQPCPTELGLQRFTKQQQMRAAYRARTQAAAAQVKDPLKSQLVGLVAKRDNVGAWKLCMSTTKKDFPTCRGIVAILAGEQPD